MKQVRIAAVQLQAEPGNVIANLARAERLVRDAFRHGAGWVILPEFFTSAMAFHPSMLDAVAPADGPPAQLLVRLAREYDGIVGGSFLALRGQHAYNTFVLAFPGGLTYSHDKDIPTMWENCYYVGGNDDGVLNTPVGNVGVALCWELLRSRTAKRMLGQVDIVVGGSCWGTACDDRLHKDRDIHDQLLSILRDTPGRFSRMLGVPVVHAAHVGTFEGFVPPVEDVPYRSCYLGETQIVDGHGHILARMSHADGEGVILANVTLGQSEGVLDTIPDSFWIPDMPRRVLEVWEGYNAQGRDYYQRTTLPHRSKGQLKKYE